MTRAWIFQEQLLSPRLLHFSNGELLWECLEGTACECSGVSAGSAGTRLDKTEVYRTLSSNDSQRIAKLWRELATWYSSLSLTLPKDVLPALSGIARTFQRVRPQDQYLAGLWKSSMMDDLAWYPKFGIERLRRPERWRAPTWSWASVCQQVMFVRPSGNPENYYCLLVRASTTFSSDPTGEVSSGSLVLSGPTKLAKVIEAEDQANFTLEAAGLTLFCNGDSVTDFESGKVGIGTCVFCLRLSTRLNNMDILLLLVAIGSQSGVYERIGITSHSTHQINEHWFKDGNHEVEVEII